MAQNLPGRVSITYQDDTSIGVYLYNYPIGSPDLLPEHRGWLDQNVVNKFQGQPVFLYLAGCTSSSGDAAYNAALADRRVGGVAYFLLSDGLSVADDFGVGDPIVDDTTGEDGTKRAVYLYCEVNSVPGEDSLDPIPSP